MNKTWKIIKPKNRNIIETLITVLKVSKPKKYNVSVWI